MRQPRDRCITLLVNDLSKSILPLVHSLPHIPQKHLVHHHIEHVQPQASCADKKITRDEARETSCVAEKGGREDRGCRGEERVKGCDGKVCQKSKRVSSWRQLPVCHARQ